MFRQRVITPLSRVSFVGWAAAGAAAALFAYLLRWLAGQSELALLPYAPGLAAFALFCWAMFRAVPHVERFWNVRLTRVDWDEPVFAYGLMALWAIAHVSLIIALAYVKTKGMPFGVTLDRFAYMGVDIDHYYYIAHNGYTSAGGDERNYIVFFPLFPFLLRCFYIIFRNDTLAGLMLNAGLAVWAGGLLRALARRLTDKQAARRALKYLYLFPSAFFLFIPMTEALFLCLSLLCVYMAVENRFGWAAFAAFLGALTRLQGLLLFVPVLMEAVRYLRHTQNARVRALLAVLAAPLGFCVYLFINQAVYGSPTAFAAIQQEHWHNHFVPFFETARSLTAYLRGWVKAGEVRSYLGLSIPMIAALFGSLALICAGAKRLRPSLTAYAMAYFVASFGASWLLSGARYVSCLFPLAIVLAQLADTKWKDRLLTLFCGVLYVLYFHMFIARYPVY